MPRSSREPFARALRALAAAAAMLAGPQPSLAADTEARFEDGRAFFDGGALRLEIKGREAWSAEVKGAPGGAAPEVSSHPLAGGAIAVDVLFRDAGGAPAFEIVALREAGARALRVLWSGTVAPSGDPGERRSAAVRFEDLTSDGAPEIVLGTAFEPVRICGREERPLLYRRAYDPRAGRFREILAKRPGAAPSSEIAGEAGVVGAPPVVPVAAAEGASRALGDRGDALLLAPPFQLLDGDPATVWSPGAGASLGEFATLGVAAEEYGVVRLGIARPAAGGKAGWRRPGSMLLVTPDGAIRLRFPEGGGGAADFVWFDLPAPARTPCLTLVVEEAEEGPGRGHLAIGEVVVLTELDREGGLGRLARDLDASASGERAAALLRRAGGGSLGPIREAWPDLGEAGRRRAVRVVAAAAAGEGAGLLAEAAVGGDEVAAREAAAALGRMPAAAAPALAPFLSTPDDAKFFRAARALAGAPSAAAVDALCGAAGAGGRERRRVVREALARLAGGGGEAEARLARNLELAAGGTDPERTMDLLRASAAPGRVPEAALAIALAAAAPGRRFEDRFRALEVVSLSRGAEALELLLAAVADTDFRIRAAAVRGLAGLAAGDGPALAALVAAAADRDVSVRLAALEGLRGKGAANAPAPSVAAIASGDPWPAVRAAALELVPELAPEPAARALLAAADDPSPDVRIRALAVAPRVPGAEVDAIVVRKIGDGAEAPHVRAAAASAARARCQASAVGALFGLLAKGAEPLAERRDVDAAVAAAGALGAIGGARAIELLGKARQRSNPATDAAIDAALGVAGVECGRALPKPATPR